MHIIATQRKIVLFFPTIIIIHLFGIPLDVCYLSPHGRAVVFPTLDVMTA